MKTKFDNLKIRSGARASTKAQERALIEKAERLRKDPDLAFPRCEGSCWFCDFKSGRRSCEKVLDAAEEEKKLERLAESGNEFARALAGTLLLRKQGKVPYLFALKTPFGEVAYAIRGSVKKERLVMMQHFDHPRAKLLGVVDLVRDKKLHIFAFEDRMVCTGRDPRPPEGFVDYLVGQLKTPLDKYGRNYLCRHLADTRAAKHIAPLPHLEISWKPAGVALRLCERCARPGENTLLSMLTYMAIPNPRLEFDFSARGGFECEGKCEGCRIPQVEMDQKTREKYVHGELDDRGLIEKQTIKGLQAIREGGVKVYILGRRCFGKDLDAFIDALNPNEEERIGLTTVLKTVKGPVVVEGETAAAMLEKFWEEHGEAAMEAVCGDREVACGLMEKYRGTKMGPSQLLKEAIACVRQKEIISQLPVYGKLPAVAKFADEMARIYFTRGKEDAARAIGDFTSEDSGVKSTAYAFLLAMGIEANRQWQYMVHEREFAEYLLPAARKFLESTPETYHQNLQAMLSATGSTETIPEPKRKS
ncbi:MAG: hypothetical protein FJ149_01215 [Euryarchaeota archaeon]|nr:hypothetical protein [Euryarchaeota archaeon]